MVKSFISDPALRPLPDLVKFRDVPVGPSPNRETPGAMWPEFQRQSHARLWRRGRPVCRLPTFDVQKCREDSTPSAFVSCVDSHFGHFVAESVPRLPQILAQAPDMPLVFTHDRKTDPAALPPAFMQVLDWFDIPMEQVRLIARATLFRDLCIAAQGEHLDGPRTPEAYLDVLDVRIAHKLPRGPADGITYVTRAGLHPAKGAHAGEAYLVDCLRELGVRVIYPETMSLRAQMNSYAESAHLVFAEGSALHGRQLIGRLDQQISVLRRRRKSDMAKNQIAPRCAGLTYVAAYAGGLHVVNRYGAKVLYAMKALFHVGAVLDHFESLNVPVRRIWDSAQYRTARDRDVLAWVHAMYDPQLPRWLRPVNDDAYLFDQLQELHLKHLRKPARDILRAWRRGA